MVDGNVVGIALLNLKPVNVSGGAGVLMWLKSFAVFFPILRKTD